MTTHENGSNGLNSNQNTVRTDGNESKDRQQSNEGLNGKGNVDNTDCPICRDKIKNKAFNCTCRHEFCYPCVMEWMLYDSRCPVCRQPFHHICSNPDREEVEEVKGGEQEEPLDLTSRQTSLSSGVRLSLGNTTTVFTPSTGMYYIIPVPSRYGYYYKTWFLRSNHEFILRNCRTDSLIVSPDRLEQTLNEMGVRPLQH